VRRLLILALLGAAAWWLVRRRRSTGEDVGATIGYADGSAVTFERGAQELDRFLDIAGRAKAG